MRKLIAAEIVVIATSLASSDPLSAEENIPTMPTVTATATYNTQTAFVFTTPSSNLYAGAVPTASALNSQAETSRVYHALLCAYVYGKAGYKGNRSGWRTWITSNYGWRSTTRPYSMKTTIDPTAPAGHPVKIGGATWILSDKTTYIFKRNLPTTTDLIWALAHEYAHQWGAQDLRDGSANDAYAIGDYAKNAYLADNGSKCDGVWN